MKKPFLSYLLGAFALFGITAHQLQATVVLSTTSIAPTLGTGDVGNLTNDVSNISVYPYTASGYSDNQAGVGQTFTTLGASPTYTLNNIYIKGGGNADGNIANSNWTVSIYSVDRSGGNPNLLDLGLLSSTGSVSSSAVSSSSDWLVFNFSGAQALTLNASTEYAFILSDSSFYGFAASTNTFSGGEAITKEVSNNLAEANWGYDRTFVVDFVAVPEPSTYALLLGGIAMVAGFRLRRRS